MASLSASRYKALKPEPESDTASQAPVDASRPSTVAAQQRVMQAGPGSCTQEEQVLECAVAWFKGELTDNPLQPGAPEGKRFVDEQLHDFGVSVVAPFVKTLSGDLESQTRSLETLYSLDFVKDSPQELAEKILDIDASPAAYGLKEPLGYFLMKQAVVMRKPFAVIKMLQGVRLMQEAPGKKGRPFLMQGRGQRTLMRDQAVFLQSEGESLLHSPELYKAPSLWCRLVLAAGIFDVNRLSDCGVSPLTVASGYSRGAEALRALVDEGAWPDARGGDTVMPLHTCLSSEEQGECSARLEYLLGLAGTDPNRVCRRYGTALHTAVMKQPTSDAVDRLMGIEGIDPNVFFPGQKGVPLAAAVDRFLQAPDALPFLVDVTRSLAAKGARLLAVSADMNPVDCARNLDLFLQRMNLETAAADRKSAIKEALEQGWHACDQDLLRGRP